MQFNISSEKFKKVINLTSRICGNNLTLPILNNILIKAEKNILSIFSTNLEIGISVLLPIKIKEEGIIVVPGKIISDFISFLPKEEIKIKEEKSIIEIKCGSFKANIPGQPPKDFPVLPEVKEKNIIELQTQELVSSFSKVNHIVSASDARVEISGVLMKFEKEYLKLVGTDSVRLAEKSINLKTTSFKSPRLKSIIIPQKTTAEFIYAFSDIEGKTGIIIEPSQIVFVFTPKDPTEPQINLISRLIEGNFPEYGEIIPKNIKTSVVLNKEEFQKKIKTISLFSSRIQDIKIKFNPSSFLLLISASSSDVGEAKTEIKKEIKGEPVEITFNWKYLLDGISAINSSEVFFGVNDSNSPAILKPIGDNTYFYILMPKTV